MAAHPQLYPLEVNPRTGEPFLRLPSPHDNIIITPPRMDDVPSMVHHLNDPKVYKTLSGPPFPYKEEHAIWWQNKIKPESDALLKELEEASKEGLKELKVVGGCPVRSLREVQEDGTDIFLGDIGTDRCGFPDILDLEEQARLNKVNAELPVGSPDIVWCIGDYLASSHHGRGIMSLALRTLIDNWMVPRMNAKLIRAEAFLGNKGSTRVFEKCGFVETDTVDDPKIMASGELRLGYHVLWWRYDDQ